MCFGDILGQWDLGVRRMDGNAKMGLLALLTVGFWVTGWWGVGETEAHEAGFLDDAAWELVEFLDGRGRDE